MHAITPDRAEACPVDPPAAGGLGISPDDLLVLPLPKRMVVQRVPGDAGLPELHLFYGPKDVSFDEPEYFAFGERLAQQTRFRAEEATTWGAGYAWATVRPLLEHLMEEGILQRADDHADPDIAPGSMVRPSPLPPSTCPMSRTWAECEAVTEALTGQSVELGHLELIVPVFRVAHIALDADGRQIGEANVFPRGLRLDIPTTWVTCAYPGTRYMSDRPMNVTALKAMRLHWRQMMAALLRIRSAFLRRFPDVAEGWTVGRVERLTTLVLSVPTYQLARADRPLANGSLHPALSSLFRVTDGLRMTMHQMLFIPIGEPMRSPEAPVTSAEIFEYAERNYALHSETGVCAGPQHMIQEFLQVILDGRGSDASDGVVLDPAVEAALADIETAFDYGLHGLRAFAVVFSLWPAMTRAYEQLSQIVDAAVGDGLVEFAAFSQRLRPRVEALRQGTYLATEQWRTHRETVYADMYEQCGRGLASPREACSLAEQTTPVRSSQYQEADRALGDILARRLRPSTAGERALRAMQSCLMEFFATEQGILRAAGATQHHINRLLGRACPRRPFGSADVNVHNLLQGNDPRRLPYLLDELDQAWGVGVVIDAQRIEVIDRRAASPSPH